MNHRPIVKSYVIVLRNRTHSMVHVNSREAERPSSYIITMGWNGTSIGVTMAGATRGTPQRGRKCLSTPGLGSRPGRSTGTEEGVSGRTMTEQGTHAQWPRRYGAQQVQSIESSHHLGGTLHSDTPVPHMTGRDTDAQSVCVCVCVCVCVSSVV